MPRIVGVRFKRCGKIYNFEIDGIDAAPGAQVIVESEMGLSLGVVVTASQTVEISEQQLKKVVRIATEEDIKTDENNRSLEEEAKVFCLEKVKSRNLPMKIVGTEATLDKKRLIFYFIADGRIDFRELVRDLASKFKTRIEMRQIGVRDEVKHVGAIGICGREVCCRTFLTSFEPISIRMAKKQELVLNPGKLSGVCGRLMCCLSYEMEHQDKEGGFIGVETEDKDIVITEGVPPEKENVEEIVSSPGDTIQQPEAFSTDKKTFQPSTHRKQKPRKKEKHSYMSKTKDKGKPFSRRKKFFKKKKR